MSEDNGRALVRREEHLPDRQTLERRFAAIREFQALVKSQMVEGHDYGKIPGTTQDTLLKPGAEKMAKLLELDDKYDVLTSVEDWDRPLFHYVVRCRLVSIFDPAVELSQGLGECNSYESKYRWRNAQRKCPVCGEEKIIKGKEEYGGGWLCWKKNGGCGATFGDNDLKITEQVVGRVLNEEIFNQVNTFLKMAKKRALVDAALSAGRLSDIFTQDMEDVIEGEAREIPAGGGTPSGDGARDAWEQEQRRDGTPNASGSVAASDHQRQHIEHLLGDLGIEWTAVEIDNLPAWDDLTVPDVARAVDWLNREKKRRVPA